MVLEYYFYPTNAWAYKMHNLLEYIVCTCTITIQEILHVHTYYCSHLNWPIKLTPITSLNVMSPFSGWINESLFILSTISARSTANVCNSNINLNNMYWVVGNVICTCITSCQLRFSNHQPKQIFFIIKMLFVLQTLNEKNMLSMHFKKLMQTCPWWIWWNKYTNWDQFTKKVDLIDKYDNSSLTD